MEICKVCIIHTYSHYVVIEKNVKQSASTSSLIFNEAYTRPRRNLGCFKANLHVQRPLWEGWHNKCSMLRPKWSKCQNESQRSDRSDISDSSQIQARQHVATGHHAATDQVKINAAILKGTSSKAGRAIFQQFMQWIRCSQLISFSEQLAWLEAFF